MHRAKPLAQSGSAQLSRWRDPGRAKRRTLAQRSGVDDPRDEQFDVDGKRQLDNSPGIHHFDRNPLPATPQHPIIGTLACRVLHPLPHAHRGATPNSPAMRGLCASWAAALHKAARIGVTGASCGCR